MKIYPFLATLFLAILPGAAFAHLQVTPQREAKLRAEGKWEAAKAFMDSHGHDEMDPGLLESAQQRLRAGMLRDAGVPEKRIPKRIGGDKGRGTRAVPRARRNIPTTGDARVLVISLGFSDETPLVTPAQIQSATFGNGLSDRVPYESLRNYYSRASYGKLNVGGTVYRHTYSDSREEVQDDLDELDDRTGYPPTHPQYLTNAEASQMRSAIRETMVLEAMTALDNSGHDLSQYDNDDNGLIDGLVVIYDGDNTGWGSFWWAYYTGAWGGPMAASSIDGVSVDKYVFQFAETYENATGNVEGFDPTTLMHEFGHMIGLPDLYDYTPGQAGSPEGGVGGLDMMHANRGDINGFLKWLLDWSSPRVMTGGWGRQVLGANGGDSDREGVVMLPGAAGADWLYDDFGKAFIDPQWTVRTAGVPGGAAAAIDAGRMRLTSRAHLVSDEEYDPDVLGGIKVAGTWTFSHTSGSDFFEVLTRSDGMPTGSFGATANGVQFKVDSLNGNLVIEARNDAGQLAVTQTSTGSVGAIASGTSWDFEIFDDSDTGLAFRFTKSDDPSRMATVTGQVTQDDFAENHVVFHNREGATKIAHLDDVAIIPGPSATDLFREFFYIENRSPVGNDAGSDWPSSGASALNFEGGLAIWHVDATLKPDGRSFAFNNSSTSHKLLRLMEADGEEDIEGRRIGDAGDFWKPGQQFAPDSTPDSKLYDNSFSGIAVSVLDQQGDDIEAHFSFWSNPDARRPTAFTNAPADGLAHTANKQTFTAAGFDQSNDGSGGFPVIEFYRQGDFGSEFARFDRTANTVSTDWFQNTLGAHGAYALVYDAGDWPYVVASTPIVTNSKIGFPGDTRPSNTLWSSAITLSGSSPSTSGSNGDGTNTGDAFNEPDDPPVSATSNYSRTVWYRWTAPSNGKLTIDTGGSALDTVIALYTGGRHDRLKEVGSDDDGGVGPGDSLISDAKVFAGAVYSIGVSGYSGASGSFNLNLDFVKGSVSGDNFDSPLTRTVSSGQWFRSISTDTTNASSQAGESDHDGRPPHHSVWLEVTIGDAPIGQPDRQGRLILSTLGSEFDTVLAVYTGGGSYIDSNDDYFSDRTSALSIPAEEGDVFQVVIDGYNSSDFGPGNINVRFVQADDTSANVAPQVAITEPATTLEAEFGQSVTLEASAIDPDGLIKTVAFFERPGGLVADRIANLSATPDGRYETSWTPPAPGAYDVVAWAYDERGLPGASAPVRVNVTIGGVTPTPLGDALEVTGTPPQTGDRDWLGQEAVSRDGHDAARSHPDLAVGESSEMSIGTSGPGTLSFWWKSEGASFTNSFAVLLDGRPVEVRHGTMDWTQVALQIPPGGHTVSWRFTKDLEVPGEIDAGWVDLVRGESGLAPLAVGLGDLTKVYAVGGDGGWVTAQRDGELVANSGATSNNGESTLRLEVTGPKTVDFEWAVISQGGFDFLDYSLDGVPVAAISGWKGWAPQRLEVPAGDHVIEWRYRKDSSFGREEDRGYLRALRVYRADVALTGLTVNGGDALLDYLPDPGWRNTLHISSNLTDWPLLGSLPAPDASAQNFNLTNGANAERRFFDLRIANDFVPSDGPRLLGWWDFDEADIFGLSFDASRQGFAAQLEDGASLATSRPGRGSALSTNGTGGMGGSAGHAQVLDSAGTGELFPAGGVTVAAWVKPGTTVGDCAIAGRFEWTGGDLSGYTLSQWIDGRFVMGVAAEGAGTMAFASAPFTPGVWQHVAGTYDGSAVRLYIDGVKVAETGLTGLIDRDPVTAHGFQIGRYKDSNESHPFDGRIDDLGVWDGALSELQIKRLANP